MNLQEQINCILDCRISSTKQSHGVGLEEQIAIGENFINARGWNLAKTFSKVYSGRAEEREDFQLIINYILEQRNKGIFIHKYVVKSLDRFTRGGVSDYADMKQRLANIGVELVDATGIIQGEQNSLAHTGLSYDWSIYSPSESAEIYEAKKAKDEVRAILTRMIGAEIRYTRDGYHTNAPNDGYLNEKIMTPESKKKTIQVPDPDRSHFFIKAFELRAEGVLSDIEIVEHINAMGFKTKDRNKWDSKKEKIIGKIPGKPMTVKYLQSYIQNPIYAGVKLHKWGDKPIPQNYPGLVSVELFNKANKGKIFIKENSDGSVEILYDQYPEKQVKKRMKYNPLYPYAKVVTCNECQKHMKASATRSKSGERHPAYHCDRGEKGKDKHYFRVPKKEFDDAVESMLDSIEFTPEYKESFRFMIKKKFRERESEILKDSSQVSVNIADLKTKKQTEVDAYVNSQSISIRTEIEKRIDELDQQIKQAESQRGKLDLQEQDIDRFLGWTDKIMEHPKEILGGKDNLEQKTVLWNLFFDELPTYEDVVNGTLKLARIFNVKQGLKADESAVVSQYGEELFIDQSFTLQSNNFYVPREDMIGFVFSKYEILPGVFGPVQVEVENPYRPDEETELVSTRDNTASVKQPVTNFESCLSAGGVLLEIYPRACVHKEQTFTEAIGAGFAPGAGVELEFVVGPEKASCVGAGPQECLIVNGEYFYDEIMGFEFRQGIEQKILVQRTLRWNESEDTPQDISKYSFKLKAVLSERTVEEEAGKDTEVTNAAPVAKACVVSGCSSQLCISKAEAQNGGGLSTCEYLQEYACYAHASCEVQQTGECGWTQTDDLTQCIDNARAT